MDRSDALRKSKQVSYFVVAKIDKYVELTKSIPAQKTNAKAVARLFLEHRDANFAIPSNLLTFHVLQLLPKLFEAVCCTVGMNNITTTEFHTQKSGQEE